MTVKPLLVTLLLLLAAVPAAGGEDPVVARAGDTVVTREQYRAALVQSRTSGDLGALADSMTAEGKRKLLDDLVDLRLIAARARREGVAELPEVKALVQLATDTALVREYLRIATEKLDFSSEGLMHFYREHPDLFRSQIRVKAAHVVTATREEALAAKKEILSGTPLGQVAKQVNTDSTKQLAGELGWVKKGLFVKNFEEALFALKAGELSEVVQTSFGFHVIRVHEVDLGAVKPFEAVKDEVRKAMAAEAVSRLREELKRGKPVTVDLKSLEGL